MRIVADPWLLGSCYWRSWWNFPEPPAELIADLKPDYIYLTHLHWDHFHGPSLKKLFAPTTRIIVPKIHTSRMVDDLRWLGFQHVTEIPHGSTMKLGDDFTLTSYQFNLLGSDSAMLLTGRGRTIFNANDCKLFGLPLRQVTKAFPRIDFVLRSHSSATPIPYCIDGYRDMFPNMRSQQQYIEEFCHFALHVGARYAIPFASNHCFLHKETIRFNDTAVSPMDVQSYYQQLAAKTDVQSECVVMAPGSRWSDVDGFHLVPFDYARREGYIQSMSERHHDTLRAQYDFEAAVRADFDSFRKYFTGMIRAIPWVIRRMLSIRVIFRTGDARGEHNWLVDMVSGTVEEMPTVGGAIIEVPAAVLNDCTRVPMFSVWPPSKRLRIFLPSRARFKSLVIFLQLLDMYELNILPLRKNFSLRAMTVRARRWREIIEMGRMILKHGILRRPIEIARLYSGSRSAR